MTPDGVKRLKQLARKRWPAGTPGGLGGQFAPASARIDLVRRSSEEASRVIGAAKTTELRRRHGGNERKLNVELREEAGMQLKGLVSDFLVQAQAENDDLAMEMLDPDMHDERSMKKLERGDYVYQPSPRLLELAKEIRRYGREGFEAATHVADRLPSRIP